MYLVFHLNEKQARLLGNTPLDPLNLNSLTTSALSRSFWLRLAGKCPNHIVPKAFPFFLSPRQCLFPVWGVIVRTYLQAFVEMRKKRENGREVRMLKAHSLRGSAYLVCPQTGHPKPLSPGTSLGKNLVEFLHAGLREDN